MLCLVSTAEIAEMVYHHTTPDVLRRLNVKAKTEPDDLFFRPTVWSILHRATRVSVPASYAWNDHQD